MSETEIRARDLNWRADATPGAQATAVAEHIVAALEQAIDARGRASLALSGGRGPERFLRELDRSSLDWNKVTITLVDERWVPTDQAQSNAGLIRRCLPRVLQQASWLPLYRGIGLEADARAAHEALEALQPLDVLVLGMGVDGHTASLFPHMSGLAEYLSPGCPSLCVDVPAEGARLARLSMTARAIMGACHRLLVITGETKRQTLERALAQKDALSMPIEAMLAAPLDIFYSPDGAQDS